MVVGKSSASSGVDGQRPVVVEITEYPQFWFTITVEELDAFMLLAKRHYDGACQRAALGASETIGAGYIGSQARNGMLYIWKHFFLEPGANELTVSCTWGDLDLLAKITELHISGGSGNEDVDAIGLLWHYRIADLLSRATKLTQGWKSQVIVL